MKIGFPGLLALLLIALKLTGYVTFSWLWVFAPLWLPMLFVLVVFVGYAILISVIKPKIVIKRN